MFGLIATLISTLGATGMGSMLKMVAGVIDRIGAAQEAKEKRELLREMQEGEFDIEFQKAVFGNDQGGVFARGTRRIVAVIGMLNFSAVSILCTIWPSVPLITFIPPANKGQFSFLWGFFTFPVGNDYTVTITTGHISVISMVTLGAIVGFYFTPGGRR